MLLSFNNDPKLKQFYVDRVLAHQKADEIVQGTYWRNGKGCCIGCAAHKEEDAHKYLTKKTDVPLWIYKVADKIHEGLPIELAKQWPVRFFKALPIGVDLNKALYPWLIIVVESTLDKFDHSEFSACKKVIDDVLFLLRNGVVDREKLLKAANAAAAAYAAAAEYAAATTDAAAAEYAAATTDAAKAAATTDAAYAAKAAKLTQWQYFADKFVEVIQSTTTTAKE